MYSLLLFLHSTVRWLVVTTLVISLIRAYLGIRQPRPFTRADNAFRHWTATMAHIQLMLGLWIYSESPMAMYFLKNVRAGFQQLDLTFFGLIHPLLMFIAVVLVTIGSALAKRKATDHDKFKTMFFWFALTLLVIFIAIPWPFSPLSTRPFFRTF